MKKVGLLTLVVLGAVGCGEEDSEGAKDKCRDLVATFCDRVVSCAASDQDLTASFTAAELREACEMTIRESARCDRAVQVGDNYDSCLQAASTLECSESNAELRDDFLATPLICEEVIKSPK